MNLAPFDEAALLWSDPFCSTDEPRSFAQTVASHEMLDPLSQGDYLVWIASARSRWFIARVKPTDFLRAFSASLGAESLGTMPWADPRGCLDLLARAGFERACIQVKPLDLNLDLGDLLPSPKSYHFGCACFFTVSDAQFHAAALALIECIPGTRRFSGRGGPSTEAVVLARARALAPSLANLTSPSYFEDGAKRHRRLGPFIIIVDGRTRSWAFCFHAAARALGCPPELSVANGRYLDPLDIPAIHKVATRLALDDPEHFEAYFAEAIVGIQDSDLFAEQRRVAPIFEARDRICVLSAAAGAAQAPSKETLRL